MNALRTLSLTLLLLLPAKGQVAEVETSFPLQQVLIGEDALLNIQVLGEEANGALTTAEPSSLSFKSLGIDRINRQIFCANIGVSSDTPGVFKVPAFNVPLASGKAVTSETTLEVFPLDGIDWKTFEAEDKTYRIGAILLYPSGPIYEGQSVPLTAKLLIPSDLPVRSSGFAEVEKDNIGAWRMEPPMPPNYDQRVSPRPPNAIKTREMLIEGKLYQVINYVTFAAPLKSGPVTVGPGKVQGLQVLISSVQQRPGFFSNMSRSYNIELELPATSFQAAALPKGAPESFQGAIGEFSLNSSIDITTELKSGDPVMVKLEVAGRGNIDTLSAPILEAPESNWKIYPPSRNELEGDRRTNQGTAVFSQILRPMVPIKEVPPFVFTFFNPKDAKYETLRTEAIPLNLAPLSSTASGGVEAGLIPIAEMTDILGLIEPQPFRAKKPFRIGPYWQLLPALLVLVLIGIIARQQLPRLRKKDPDKIELQQNLQALAAETDDAAFLRKAAHLAESRGLPQDAFLQDLLDERDASCFQAGAEALPVTGDRKRTIIRGLKERLSCLLLFLSILLVLHPNRAAASQEQAQQAWEEGNYQEALTAYELMLKEGETPDLLYNLGSCYYRLGEPARAALRYHQALRLDPKHAEASQNLAFIERKLGAIPEPTSEMPLWATRLTRPILVTLLRATCWVAVIGLLLRFAFQRRTLGRRASTPSLLVAGILASIVGIIWFFHPGNEQEPFQPDAIIISKETAELRTEPSAGGSQILSANPSTTCKILNERGGWSYVELPSQTRGWIESETLERI